MKPIVLAAFVLAAGAARPSPKVSPGPEPTASERAFVAGCLAKHTDPPRLTRPASASISAPASASKTRRRRSRPTASATRATARRSSGRSGTLAQPLVRRGRPRRSNSSSAAWRSTSSRARGQRTNRAAIPEARRRLRESTRRCDPWPLGDDNEETSPDRKKPPCRALDLRDMPRTLRRRAVSARRRRSWRRPRSAG